jgi:hypothetical protein
MKYKPLAREFLLNRGFCCNNGCKHCPYMDIVTEAEETFCIYKIGLEGSFMTSLIETIFKGDMPNRFKLAQGFPEIVEVCNKYNHESGYWQDLVNRWNKKYPHRKLVA